MPGFDLKQISRNDQLIVGGGALAFIASFLPFWGVSYHIDGHGYSASVSAWHSYAILGLLLVFIAAGIAAARIFANASLPSLPVGVNLLVLVLAGLGTLLLILRGFTWPHASGLGGSYGVKWGGYILFIAGIAETVGAFLNFKASGEKVSWDATAMNKGSAGGAVVPPAAPYPPGGAAPSYPPADSSYPPAPSYPPAEPPASS